MYSHTHVLWPMQVSILDQASNGVVAVPTREEVEAIPMPELPILEGPANKAHFQSIAQFLQVSQSDTTMTQPALGSTYRMLRP